VERVNQHHADLSTWIRFMGVPEGVFLSAAWDLGREGRQPAEHLWTWDSGLRLERQGWIQNRGDSREPEWLALGLNALLPVTREWNREWWTRANERRQRNGLPPLPLREGRWAEARAQVPLAFAKRTQLEPPAYRLRLAFDVTKPNLVDERPLKLGEKLHTGRTTARVAHLAFNQQHGPDRHSILMESSPMLLVDAGPVSLVPLFRSMRAEPRYLLVNRARGHAVGSGGGTGGRFGTVKINRRALSASPIREFRDGKWAEAEDWFDGNVTVAALTYDWQERFVKEITVEKFELVPAAVAGGAR